MRDERELYRIGLEYIDWLNKFDLCARQQNPATDGSRCPSVIAFWQCSGRAVRVGKWAGGFSDHEVQGFVAKWKAKVSELKSL